jgi:hypothetical protein
MLGCPRSQVGSLRSRKQESGINRIRGVWIGVYFYKIFSTPREKKNGCNKH